MLNYRLVIAAGCVVIGLIFYIFYWNRIIGHLVSLLIRLVAWNQKESSVWVHIGSIHFSLLGGRVSFKDFRYHSSNQTIHVVKGQISWRYWIRVPADEDDLSHARVVGETVGGKSPKHPLSCRVHISFQGLEWFIYNRTLAYDNIVSSMEPQREHQAGDEAVPQDGRGSSEALKSLRKIFSWSSAVPDSSNLGPPISLVSSAYSRTPKFLKGWIIALRHQMPSLDPKDLLPLGIEIRKGAIVVGNESTPTLLCADFKSAEGTYGIVPSRSQHDHYKQIVNLAFIDAIVRLVDNQSHTSSMLSTGETLHNGIKSSSAHHPLRSSSYLAFNPFAKLWRKYRLWDVIPNQRRHFPFTGPSWSRRARRQAQDEETPVGADFSALEYAKETKIIEAPVLEFLYYADAVGQVPSLGKQQERERESLRGGGVSEDPFDIGNGDLPPEWGVDLAICGGVIRYGPWADRQRAILQQTFFPPTFTDAKPFVRLKPGDARVWPTLNILVELRDGVTLQIPFREASKDWQWDGEVHIPNRPRKREAAHIHVRAGDNSTISYTMPMVASARGYEPTLNIHLDTVSVTSSLNDIRLLDAESCVVRCELPSALRWNEQREWTFAISLRTPQIYLLRDHVNMFTDLGKDWASGPPSDYNRFIPMVYSVAVEMKNYDMKIYVNDHNIIDKPLIPEDNAFMSLYGAHLTQTLTIPLHKYRPECVTVSFDIDAPDVGVSLTLPKWNTHSLFGKPHRSSELGRIGEFHVGMSYCYFSDVDPENVDQLKLMFTATDVVYKACGWTIRYFMSMRQNYFGSFTHFSTLYEYLQKRKLNQPIGDPIDLQYREGSSNALQVELGVLVNSGLMIIPASMRGYEKEDEMNEGQADIGTCVMQAMPELQLQLRTHNYYMEMTLNIDTISTTTHLHCPEDVREAWAIQRSAKEVVIIDSLDIVAHRLFGPLPRTSTYFCIWEFHVGNVAGRLTALEARTLAASGRQFGLNFTDPMNAPAPEYEIPSDPDVTFLKVTIDQLNLAWQVDNAAAELSLPNGLRIDINDVAGKFYKSVTSIRVPLATAKLLICHSVGTNDWHEAMSVQMDSNIDIYSAPPGWKEKAQAQTEFLVAQDSHTERVMFLYMPDQALPYDTIATGRGLLDTQFYLPQVRIPKSYRPQSTVEPQEREPRANAEYMPSPLPLPRYLVNYSESDSEDYISEADRDARLARLRPVSRIMIPDEDDDDSISTGDESDTDDLTYSGHSASEGDRTKDTLTESVPIISQYSRYTRTYTARSLSRPSWWYGAPFQTKRDSAYYQPLSQVRKLAEELARNENQTTRADGSLPPPDLARASPTTVIRVSSSKGVSLTILPLVLPTLHKLSTDVLDNQLTPEIRFDALFADHLESIKDDGAKSTGVTVFDINLASVQMKTLQLLPNPPGTGDPTARNRVASSMELFTSGLRIRTGQSLTSQNAYLRCSFENFALGLGTPDHTTLAFDIACGQSSLRICDAETDINLGHIVVNISRSAPAQIVLTGMSTISFVDEIRESLVAFQKGTQSRLNGEILFASLQREEGQTVLDPLSTIQPSYLIQKGRPHRLRTDAGAKYLLFLRHHLHFMGPSKLGELFQLPEDVAQRTLPNDAIELLKKQLMDLAGDIELPYVSPRSPLASLLKLEDPSAVTSSESAKGLPLNHLILRLSYLHTTCRSSDNVSSEFVLRAVLVSVGSRSAAGNHPYITSVPKSATTLSLTTEKGRQGIQHFGALITVGDVALSIFPSLVTFAQTVVHTLKVHRLGPFNTNPGRSRSASRTRTPDIGSPSAIYVDLALVTRSFRFKAGAEKLLLEYKASAVDFASTILFKPPTSERRPWEVAMNHSLTIDEIRVQAYSVADLSKPDEFAVLAAFIIGGGRVNVLLKRDAESQQALCATVSLEYIHLRVPRSAIRLYRFMEEWRADYLPGLTATVRDLLSELHESDAPPVTRPPPMTAPSKPLSLQVDVKLGCFRVSLQVMRGTWLSWEMDTILTYARYSNGPNMKHALDFGLQVVKHIFIISTKEHASDLVPSIPVRIPLPTFSVTCHHDRGRIEGLALIEMFSANVKPSHWDTLLSVQQKFGQDFSDLVSIVEETRSRTITIEREKPPSAPWKYRIIARMKGFRLGLESGSSVLLLECDHIGGSISNDPALQWHVELADLALSLAPRRVITKSSHPFDRDNRTAFVSINAKVEMTKNDEKRLIRIAVGRTHAVMQPSSIGELGDFVDHLQAEISMRKERRAQDMAEFKEKTKNLLRSLDISMHRSHSQPTEISWIGKYTVDISFANIGIAFPLTLGPSVHLSQDDTQSDGSVRAFLFSIKSITFDAQLGDSGKASMKGFAFQFVSSFRQSNERDFLGETHAARNRLLYPEMTAQLKVERKDNSRQLHIGADVDGFILDVESSIPNYISSLIEVYRQGKDRVERFASGPRTASHIVEKPSDEAAAAEPNYGELSTSNVFMALTFRSGRVRMFSHSHSHLSRTRAVSVLSREPSDDQFRDHGVEVFNLPVFTVWGEYRATPIANKLGGRRGKMEPSTLIFKSTVHSSQNTLRPTLLPFLGELAKNIEDRMRQTNRPDIRSIAASPRPVTSNLQQEDSANPVSSMRISLSLRIDRSKLELTCQPDVNVIAGLNWDSGGFVVNISPGAHRVTFSGSVGGLTVGLKHGFLSEDCMRLHARNLAFTVDFAKTRDSSMSSVSVVCDTEFSGGVRFSRLQDVLCFKAVWLDRIPIINAPPTTPGGLGTRTSSHATTASTSATRQELTTALIIRLREVRLDVDLGQSITSIQLDLRDAILRTRFLEGFSEASLSVSNVAATASGNITGHITVPNFLFQTTRKERHALSSETSGRLLDLQMIGGPLVIDLDSEYQKLLVYRAEPLDIRIYDDWSKFSPEVAPEHRNVRLTFTVKGTDVTAIISTSTVPKLVAYGNKFQATLEAQKEGARSESRAFRLVNAPKPDNPLSEVANAMFSSARSRLMEEPGFNGVIGQRLSLKLRTLRLVVFPRTMTDTELAQFIGSNLHACLDRVVESETLPPARDLKLSFTSISVSKITSLNYSLAAKQSTPLSQCQQWLSLLTANASQATIFSLPSMSMQMHSDETVEDGVRVLPYDFTSKFTNAAGVREEDIYITLNMSLYSWLTLLRKTFTREMDQVQASADVRASASLPHTAMPRRSKALEPLKIDKDGTSAKGRMSSPPPFSPSKKRASLSHTKSTPSRFSVISPTSAEFIISPASPTSQASTSASSTAIKFPTTSSPVEEKPSKQSRPPSPGLPSSKKTAGLTYRPRQRTIERLTLRQLGEATPDVMHPFFMKTAGFSLEDSLPQYVHEYATMPTEEIMKALLKLYSKQLKAESLVQS